MPLQEVEEEQVVIHQVSSDKDLAELVRKGSQGIQELEQMTGGSSAFVDVKSIVGYEDLTQSTYTAGWRWSI